MKDFAAASSNRAPPSELQKISSVDLFYGAMVHKIKSPLTVIMGYAEILYEESLQKELPGNILIHCRLLNEMVEKDLVFIKDHLNNWENAGEWEDNLGAKVVEVVDQLRNLVQDRTEFSQENGPVSAWLDPDKFLIIIHHLLENAVKYSPEDSAIKLHLVKSGQRAVLEVENLTFHPIDSHTGFFEPFQRNAQGTGLGLYIVSEYMRQIGGRIEMDHSVPGKIIFRLDFNSRNSHTTN